MYFPLPTSHIPKKKLYLTLKFNSQLTVNKGVKTIKWGMYNLFSKCCWDNWMSICRRIKWNLYLTSH